MEEFFFSALQDRQAAAMLATTMTAEGMGLQDLHLLQERHLQMLAPTMLLGPRLRLLKYIEEHPVEQGIPDTSPTEPPLRVRSRRVSKSLLRAEELTSAQFMRVWNSYAAGRERIEGEKVTAFLNDMLRARAKNDLSEHDLRDGRTVILDAFGTPEGALEMATLQQLLSVEECFLMKFRSRSNISSAAFMRIYMHYDEDGDGFIRHDELDGLLRDLLLRDRAEGGVSRELSDTDSVSPAEVKEYAEVLLEIFDRDHDGTISLSELSKVLSTERSYLDHLKGKQNLTTQQFKKIFCHYDKTKSRVISGPELLALAWDELRSEGFEDAATIQDIQQRKDQMLDLTESQTGEITPEQLARLLGLDTGLAVW